MKALIRQQLAAALWVTDPANTDPDELVEALLPVVQEAAKQYAAEGWDAGYIAAQLDADEEPYSDRPERATWRPRQNPYRADELRIVLEDDVDWHDIVQHPVWQEGCAACVAGAEWIEANRL